MQKERLAEYLERYHLGASNAATSRELEPTFGIKGFRCATWSMPCGGKASQSPAAAMGTILPPQTRKFARPLPT